LLVHIDDPPKSNQAASLESQMIPTIQYVLGRALTVREPSTAWAVCDQSTSFLSVNSQPAACL
jgi:hypothetical protein